MNFYLWDLIFCVAIIASAFCFSIYYQNGDEDIGLGIVGLIAFTFYIAFWGTVVALVRWLI